MAIENLRIRNPRRFAWGIAFFPRLVDDYGFPGTFGQSLRLVLAPNYPSDSRGHSMQTAPTPACPKCGSTKVKRLGEHQQFDDAGVTVNRLDTPIRTIYTYECECGIAFTHTVVHEKKLADD